MQRSHLDKVAFLIRELSSATLGVSVLGSTAREIERLYHEHNKEPHGIEILAMIDANRYAATISDEVQQDILGLLHSYCKRII